ncbi:DoxX family protein [Nocardiopsis sp. HUAS JQ3]|uniref:DoxX family protein n=1 Tax=Nocardiopsis sp. HUAS JQ3 TaxID=3061629 RepID=UPI0023A9A9E2|nr:DoxX family protein [Nocardiopsis sp. HUAS JQ3]WDZ89464.1 DoxX family protein [Nocardiopsis sp. HUAS JQ3]
MQRARPYPRPRISRGRLYDVVAALVRVGVGWMFTEYGLALRGREAAVAEHLDAAGLGVLSPIAGTLPALLVALSIAFAVGLLTWLTGPLLAVAAVLGALTAGSPDLAPISSWGTTSLVTAVCVLMAVSGGRWSWDHLVLSPRVGVRHRKHRRQPPATRGRDGGVSSRLPEHAPPLLYPVEQAVLRRPYRL